MCNVQVEAAAEGEISWIVPQLGKAVSNQPEENIRQKLEFTFFLKLYRSRENCVTKETVCFVTRSKSKWICHALTRVSNGELLDANGIRHK